MADTHRFVGNHADFVQVGDKTVPVAPGDFVSLTKKDLEDPSLKAMIDDGTLVALSEMKGGETQ